MKFFFQIFLTILLFIMGFIFYKNYLVEEKVNEVKQNNLKIENLDSTEKQVEKNDETNLIKNLKYNVELIDSGNG